MYGGEVAIKLREVAYLKRYVPEHFEIFASFDCLSDHLDYRVNELKPGGIFPTVIPVKKIYMRRAAGETARILRKEQTSRGSLVKESADENYPSTLISTSRAN